MRNKLTALLAGVITTLFLAVGLTVTTATAASKPDSCTRVAKADRTLCAKVKRQIAYAYATEGGFVEVPNGRALVKDITHQGLTKTEMHSYLRGEALAYKRHVTDARSVAVDLGSVLKHHGSDAQVIAGFHDRDGKPGGKKDNRVELDLP